MSLPYLKVNPTSNASFQWQAGHSCSKILVLSRSIDGQVWNSSDKKRRFFANPTGKWEIGWTRDSSRSKSEDYPRTCETLRSSESSRSKSKVDAGRSRSVLVTFNFYSLVLTGINQIQFRFKKVYTCSNHNLFLHRLVNHWLLACRKLLFISLIQPWLAVGLGRARNKITVA